MLRKMRKKPTTQVLYLEKLAGEDERANNKKSHVARGMKELRAAPGAACLGCLDTHCTLASLMIMASRVKTRSSEVSGVSPSCSKKGNGSSSGQPGTSQERDPSVDLVEKVLERVLDRLSAAMDEAVDRLVQRAITSMNAAFEARIAALEAKFQGLPAVGQHERQPSDSGESNSTACIQNQVLRLQHSLARQEHEANFVLSGVPEKEVEEEPVHTVVEACKKLGVDVSASDLLEVRRLGRLPQDRSRQSQVRSRPLLVKTTSKQTKTKILTQARTKSTPDQPRTLYFNEDLTKEEQARRKTLVPVYKELRKRNVKCRLDRGSIVINDRMIFDHNESRGLLNSNPLSSTSSSQTASPPAQQSFAQVAAATASQ